MEIRVATPEDCPGLLPIQREVQQLHHRGFPNFYRNPDDDHLRRAMTELVAADDTTVWTALVEAVPVGFLVFKLITAEETPFSHARREGLIDQLAVDGAFVVGVSAWRSSATRNLMPAASVATSYVWECWQQTTRRGDSTRRRGWRHSSSVGGRSFENRAAIQLPLDADDAARASRHARGSHRRAPNEGSQDH